VLAPLAGDPVAEAWCATFDAESGQTWAAKRTAPLGDSTFETRGDALHIEIAGCRFRLGADGGEGQGEIRGGRFDLRWRKELAALADPVCMFPTRRMVDGPFPRSKLLTPLPVLRFDGGFDTPTAVGAEVTGWTGMQGHNWGREHAFEYAWGQCVFTGGDEASAPIAMMEGFSGRIRLGPITTPLISALIVRKGERTYRFDRLFDVWNQRVALGDLRWTARFRGRAGTASLSMEADAAQVVCLGYPNPDGALAYCLNSKLARTVLQVSPRSERAFECTSEHGGALEFLRRTADPRFPDPV
jgi:hypothetical protein